MIREIDPRGPNVTWKSITSGDLSPEERELWADLGWLHRWSALFQVGQRNKWHRIKEEVQKQLERLGFNEQSWNDPSYECPILQVPQPSTGIRPKHPEGANATWDVEHTSLSREEKAAWSQLGWRDYNWDSYRKGERRVWDGCPERCLRELAVLHHTKRSWDDANYRETSPSPSTEWAKRVVKPDIRPQHPDGPHATWDVAWADLNSEEQRLWMDVGYDAESWASRPPKQSVARWERITTAARATLAQLYFPMGLFPL